MQPVGDELSARLACRAALPTNDSYGVTRFHELPLTDLTYVDRSAHQVEELPHALLALIDTCVRNEMLRPVERPQHIGSQQAIDMFQIATAKRGIEVLDDGHGRA